MTLRRCPAYRGWTQEVFHAWTQGSKLSLTCAKFRMGKEWGDRLHTGLEVGRAMPTQRVLNSLFFVGLTNNGFSPTGK